MYVRAFNLFYYIIATYRVDIPTFPLLVSSETTVVVH